MACTRLILSQAPENTRSGLSQTSTAINLLQRSNVLEVCRSPELYLSETIYPGEFFGSGTVGNGCGLEQLRFLKSGDIVELEIERIGVLRNRVRT